MLIYEIIHSARQEADTGQEFRFMFASKIRTEDHCEVNRGMVVGAGLNISETDDLRGFSQTTVSRVSTE